ncbi:MAG: hypothetical protein WDN46_10270 [Methylocella sp.]
MIYFINVYEESGLLIYGMPWAHKGDCEHSALSLGGRPDHLSPHRAYEGSIGHLMEIRYSYKNAPTVKRFAQSDAFIRGLMGPFGSGKTSGCIIEIIKRSLAQKPGRDGIRRSRWGVIRNTYSQLSDTTIKSVLQWLPPIHFGTYNKSDHNYLITGFENCSIEIMFRALDRPDQVSNLLSLELTGAWVNEAREVPWAIIEALRPRAPLPADD